MIYELPENFHTGHLEIKQKNVCLVHQSIWRSAEGKIFIEKVLAAAKLEANKNMDLLEIDDELYLPIRELPKFVENLILFGISSKCLGMQTMDRYNHCYQFQNKHILFANHPNTYLDTNAKRELWQALLSMPLI